MRRYSPVILLLLWIVNVSGYLPLPAPLPWVFNVLVLIIFVIMLLHIAGIWSPHSFRIGTG